MASSSTAYHWHAHVGDGDGDGGQQRQQQRQDHQGQHWWQRRQQQAQQHWEQWQQAQQQPQQQQQPQAVNAFAAVPAAAQSTREVAATSLALGAFAQSSRETTAVVVQALGGAVGGDAAWATAGSVSGNTGGQVQKVAVPIAHYAGNAGQYHSQQQPEHAAASAQVTHEATAQTVPTLSASTPGYANGQKVIIPENAPTMIAGAKQLIDYILRNEAMRRAVIRSVKVRLPPFFFVCGKS